jgi:thioredoxin-dependent peroxiredoxin
MLKNGQPFPDFLLPNQNAQSRTLADYAGAWLILYVYPKDDTPGCTIQGKAFTEHQDAFTALGAKVVGLSADGIKSHRDFCTKYNLTVDLLSDTGAQLLGQLGVGQTEFRGQMYWNRSTFIIDPQGIIRKTYVEVQPQGHEAMLLKDLRDFLGKS